MLPADEVAPQQWLVARPARYFMGASYRRLRAATGACQRLKHGYALRAVSLRDDVTPLRVESQCDDVKTLGRNAVGCTHDWNPATTSVVLYDFFIFRGFRSHLWRSLHPRLGSVAAMRLCRTLTGLHNA